MTSPEQSALAEKVARADWEGMGFSWQSLVEAGGHGPRVLEAQRWLNALPAAGLAVVELPERTERYRHLLGCIWLYVDWRWLTTQLTTEQKELWADAVDAFGEPSDDGWKADRWWRDQGGEPQ